MSFILPSVSGITLGNIGWAVRCQRSVRWYHQRWPLILPAGRGVWSILARTTTLSKPRFAVALCTDMRLRLSCAKNHCQNRISVCVCVPPYNRVISLQTALGSFETFSSPKPSRGNRFTFCLINTHTLTPTQSHANTQILAWTHKEEKTSHLVPRAEALLWEVGETSIALR